MAPSTCAVPFENSSDNEVKEVKEGDKINKNKSLIELPDEKINERTTPPERSKT